MTPVESASGTCGGGSAGDDAIWWLQCPADARTYLANTCTGTSYDSVLHLRFNGNPISCNDDGCGLQSSMPGALTSGAGVVQLFVDGYNTATGSYSTSVTF